MRDLLDYDIQKTDELPRREPAGKVGAWIAAVVVVAAAAIALYVVYGRRPTHRPTTAGADAAASASPPARPLGADAEPIALPPLGESDQIVRDLVRRITSHPQAVAWLATNGLIRNFTVVVANVVEGATPARHLGVLRPKSPFKVVEKNGGFSIDAQSYERYDAIAAAAASIDPAGAARTYATLKPRIEEAYAELGVQPASFDAALERAIVVLLQTPAVDGPVALRPAAKGIDYAYADQKLENLTAAQKQLLRTGPRNVRSIKAALRQLALALGIPPERLP